MKRKIEINIAWVIWNLLADLNDKIRLHYEEEFLDAIQNDEDLLFFKERFQDVIPF
jgi:hypothetical protein